MHPLLIGFFIAILIALTALAEPLQPAQLQSSAADQQSLALTVYTNDLALIRDVRKLRLPQGLSRLALTEVSAQIRSETARLYGDLTVLEQQFDYDLLAPQKLLEKYVGREVGLVRVHPQTGEEKLEHGKLLSVAEGEAVLRFANRIEIIDHNSPWRIVFDEAPADLREWPTLTMLVDNPREGERQVELSYLSTGLSWNADYVATLKESDDAMNLTVWVTLTNTSGASYRNARLQLIAGNVEQVAEELSAPRTAPAAKTMQAAPTAAQQEELFEYHLYTLERPITIADQQTKQVLLMQVDQVPVKREYRIDTSSFDHLPHTDKQDLNTEVLLHFKNERPALGKPLPAGNLRFYQRDRSGAMQFIGEQHIDDIPESQEVELSTGNAFDITATRQQTGFRKGYGNEMESSWEVEIFNAKAEPVNVQVLDSFPGEWRILEESLPHKKQSAKTVRWTVPVPAKGQTALTYKVWMR